MENSLSQKKKIDPGWNDPPVLNYTNSNPPPKSRIMNKRIAYPLFSNQEQKDEKSSVPKLPPMKSPSAFCSSQKLDKWDSSKKLEETLSNFYKYLSKSKLEQNELIEKMVENLKNLWKENKLSKPQQQLFFSLSKSLIENDIVNAEKCYCSLTSFEGNWDSLLLGLRHLLNVLK